MCVLFCLLRIQKQVGLGRPDISLQNPSFIGSGIGSGEIPNLCIYVSVFIPDVRSIFRLDSGFAKSGHDRAVLKSVQADVFRRKLPENLSLFAQIDSNQMSECYEWQKIGDRDSAASSLTFLFFIFEIVFRIAKERIKTRFRSGKYRTSYDRKRYPSKLQRSLDGSLT